MTEVQYGVRVTDREGVTKVRACHSLDLARMEAADYNASGWHEADVVRRVIPEWEPIRAEDTP